MGHTKIVGLFFNNKLSYGFPQDIFVSYLGIGKEAVLKESDRFALKNV